MKFVRLMLGGDMAIMLLIWTDCDKDGNRWETVNKPMRFYSSSQLSVIQIVCRGCVYFMLVRMAIDWYFFVKTIMNHESFVRVFLEMTHDKGQSLQVKRDSWVIGLLSIFPIFNVKFFAWLTFALLIPLGRFSRKLANKLLKKAFVS